MPRVKQFSAYPTLMLDIVREAAEGNQRVAIELSDHDKAVSWRGYFNSFLGACYRNARGKDATQGAKDIAVLASQVTTRIVPHPDGTATVEVFSREHSWQAEVAVNRTKTPLGPPKGIPGPDDETLRLAGLLPPQPQADGTALPTTARSEQRAAEAAPYGYNPEGSVKKTKYY